MFTIDFETYYAKDYSLSKLTTEQYVRDPRFEVIGVAVKRDNQPTVFHPADPRDWKGSIKKALDQYNLNNEVVLAHNAVFDMAILNWHFDIRPKFILDTLSMARPVTMLTVGGSLKALAEMFDIGRKGTEVHNMIGVHCCDMTPAMMHAYGEYCKLDVDLTYQLYFKLKQFSSPMELRIIDIMMRMFTEPMLKLDTELLQSHLEDVRAKQAQLLRDVGMDSRDVLMSNQKFAEALRALGVEPPMKISPTTGKESFAFAKKDVEFMELLEHPDERVQTLVAARLGLKSTIEETRTEQFLGIAARGALPVMLIYYGGHTGRAAGGEKCNLQNLPRGGTIRRSICAPDGYSLVACDSSQIEARMSAWFAGQNDLVQQFANNEDVYCIFATDVFGRPITKADKTERHVGKTCLAADTEVLTDSGWKRIIDISTDDLLWDGESWVTHNGVIEQGQKDTVSMYGVTATPDHLCWTGTTYVPFQTLTTDSSLYKQAVSSVTLPSLDTVTTSQSEGGGTDGSHTAPALAGESLESCATT